MTPYILIIRIVSIEVQDDTFVQLLNSNREKRVFQHVKIHTKNMSEEIKDGSR